MQHNPFSTRYTLPGCIPFYFSDGLKITDLYNQLIAQKSWTQIVGQHGTGKSTLLAELTELLRYQKFIVIATTLHDNQHGLPLEFWEQCQRDSPETKIIAAIDGYEQLSFLNRFYIKRLCRKRDLGLIVTVHTPVIGFPVLYHTRTSVEILRHLLGHLPDTSKVLPCDDTLVQLFDKHNGNIRNVFFELYDLSEQKIFLTH